MAAPVVIITGASRGIGLAAAEILLDRHKANVVSLSRSQTPALATLGRKYPSTLQIVQCDVTNESATASAIAAAHRKYGRLDALILNAGSMLLGRIGSPESSVDAWKQLFDTNFFSLLHTVRSALPHLRDCKGRIIFVSSGAAVGGTTAWGAYNASKAAMNSFCRTLANEEPDITCIALRPGVVDTDMQARLRAEGGASMLVHEHARFLELHATGTMVKPIDAGGVIAALALKATKDFSGKFISWDVDELAPYRD